jgi:L-threonylcarbamoyladenylate synthase
VGNIENLLHQYASARVAILSFQTDFQRDNQFILSPEGKTEVAAQNLFAALRTLGKMNVDLIIAEEFPEAGLGRAINDRQRRAAAK